MEFEEFSRVIGHILGSAPYTMDERNRINKAIATVDSIEELPEDIQELLFKGLSEKRHLSGKHNQKDHAGGHGASGVALSGQQAHDSVPKGLYKEGTLTPAQEIAIKNYETGWSMVINDYLRNKRQGDPDYADEAKTVASIDSAMDKSVLPQPIQTWRGMLNSKLVFGNSFDSDLTGFEWSDLGYGSTTTNRNIAKDIFTLKGKDSSSPNVQGDVVMKVSVPAGVKALQLSTFTEGSKVNGAQAEITLQSGLKWRVVKDNGFSTESIRELEVEVQPING